MSYLQSPAQLKSYRSRPIPKLSIQAALLERDYLRYQQRQKKGKFIVKTIIMLSLLFIISLTVSILMGVYFKTLIEKKVQNCTYSTYSTKWDFKIKCQKCQNSFVLKQGQCYDT